MDFGKANRAAGSYCLLIELPRPCRISVGALGVIEFNNGFYAYVGSAMGGLQGRINRHLRRVKRVRWHIDYFLENGMVQGVLYAPTDERLECRLAQRLEQVCFSIPEFGSSDCRCPSHLFYYEDLQTLRAEAVAIFKGLLREGELVIAGC
jgi:Uri superfamily endonuclease